ncbi:MAG TPA: hypothetical protein VKG23_01280 [Thermoanaerobaculia bacterium]|nr:hypothetical protein [Thermoanaerobaculia bacterium]
MGLSDDLRAAAASIDPQFVPSSNETGPLLAALVAYTEHGDKFLKAAEGDDATAKVTELLADKPDKPEKGKG